MLHRLLRAAVLAGALLAAPSVAGAAPVPPGPAGTAFYTPGSPLGGKTHGDVLRARRLTGAAAVPGAARTDLLLYRGTGVGGRAVAISGALSIPKGKAPAGGWPVVSFAHGTTGLADSCAPTRSEGAGFSRYVYPTLTTWLKRGWAVARTDYEGLGTPGVHPYLVGASEGRSVLDIVRASAQLDPRISKKRVLIAGHSQGGHAAVWAASLARGYTPELAVKGTVGFAPASHTGEQATLITALKDPSPLTGLAASILAGIEVERPALKIAEKLSDRARALYPDVLTACLPALLQPTSFGALAPSELLRPDVDVAPIVAALNANDPESVTVRTPLRVEQGTDDTTVFPVFTDQLVTELRARGTRVTSVQRQGANHGDIVAKATAGATAWMAQRLKG